MDHEMRNKRKQSVEIDLNLNPLSKRVCTEQDLSPASMRFHLVETPQGESEHDYDCENEQLGYEGDRDDTDEEEEDFDKEKLSDFEAGEDRMCDREAVVDLTSENGGRRKPFSLALHFLCAVQNTMFALLHSTNLGALSYQVQLITVYCILLYVFFCINLITLCMCFRQALILIWKTCHIIG